MNRKAIRKLDSEDSNNLIEVQQFKALDFNKVPKYHYHNSFEIMIIQSGNIEVMLNCILKTITHGSIIMIGCNLPHSIIRLSDDFIGIIIHFHPKTLLMEVESISSPLDYSQFILNCKYGYKFSFSKTYNKVVNLSNMLQKTDGFLKMSYFFHLLHILSTDTQIELLVTNPEMQLPNSKHPYNTSTNRALYYLYQHFQEQISLDEIATYANQNPSALCRAFKRAYRFTLFEFINRLRIEKACQLLRNSDINITEIAYQVGYNTFSHFSSQFLKITKITARKYREKMQLL